MSNAFIKENSERHCERCGRKLHESASDYATWNVVFKSGYVTGYVCPGCQTREESEGADANAAELEGSTLVDWNSLSERKQAELRVQAIYQCAHAVIKRHRDRAEKAGKTHVKVEVDAWAAEAIAEWPGIVGQPESAKVAAREVAADEIRAALGLEVPQA